MQPEDVFFRVEANGAFRLEGHAMAAAVQVFRGTEKLAEKTVHD